MGDKAYWLRVKKISQELRQHNLREQVKSIAYEMFELLQASGMSNEQIEQYFSLCLAELKKGKLTKSKEKEIFDFVFEGITTDIITVMISTP